MSDLRAKERHDPDWDGMVVDLIEEDRLVAIVYQDEGGLFTEFYPDDDGKPWVFEAADLQRALDTAAAILGPDEDEAVTAFGEEGQHPVDALALKFDATVIRRGPEDEGFYPLPIAVQILAVSAQIGLAVVYLEGVTVHSDGVESMPGHKAELGKNNAGGPFALFQAECNTQAAALLDRWQHRPDFGVSFEVQDAEGEQFVL